MEFFCEDEDIVWDDDLEGGDIEVVDYGSDDGPDTIAIFYGDDQEAVFESSRGGNWTAEITGRKSECTPDYQTVLKLVRTLLGSDI